MIEIYEYKAFKPKLRPGYVRADLEIYGIDTFRQSYSGLIYFNTPRPDPKNLNPDDPACAGQFAIFGHLECTGDDGHCHMRAPQRFDTRRSSPLTPAFKRVEVTEGLRRALDDTDELAITIVVADELGSKAAEEGSDYKTPLLKCKGLQLVTFA
ncbi:hypothetical protein [Pseudoruegeria sp. HB172150]|uniref:hypothetical protein n=1 Tax=Pseudoruegeria sp. HB172150 TaxID=2721164 RepID=UPI001553FE39|nr:hypothetical protein [Pseudoruegeria sp. HB172150]